LSWLPASLKKIQPFLLQSCRSRGPVDPLYGRVWGWEDGEHEEGHSVPCLCSSFKTEKFAFATYGKSLYLSVIFVLQSCVLSTSTSSCDDTECLIGSPGMAAFLPLAPQPVSWSWPALLSSSGHSSVLPLHASFFCIKQFGSAFLHFVSPSTPWLSSMPSISDTCFPNSLWDFVGGHPWYVPAQFNCLTHVYITRSSVCIQSAQFFIVLYSTATSNLYC
jgi:hypothetical protein